MSINITDYWGKTTSTGEPGISAYQHMLNVGWVAKRLAELQPDLTEQFHLSPDSIGGLAALHDLGKISPGFQRKCLAWLENNNLLHIDKQNRWDTLESNHGMVSQAAIMDFFERFEEVPDNVKYIATIVASHHGRLLKLQETARRAFRGLTGAASERISGIDWDTLRQEAARAIWAAFGNPSLPDFDEGSPGQWWLAGLTTVADWIGSDENHFPDSGPYSFEQSVAMAKKALDHTGFKRSELCKGLTFNELFGFQPNDMQTKTMAAITGPGVYVIEAPMGQGKTEAALGAAYQLLVKGTANGVYFALPTQATSNRIHLRMNDFINVIAPDQTSSRLIHANSWLLEKKLSIEPAKTSLKQEEDARKAQDWFASAKRALIAPFGVGTVDQALLGVVAAKHFFVRHFALAGKVVIIDEVHSYDLYTGTLVDVLIKTLENLGCTVIILSATLTYQRLRGLLGSESIANPSSTIDYPLISGRTGATAFTPIPANPPPEHMVKVLFCDVDAAEDEARTLATKGGVVLWICDTVEAAQNQYRRFAADIPIGVNIGLLHSRFTLTRREELENEWMKRLDKTGQTRCGCILVSTQIVEQSVDLDADLMVTELAPSDMLLQRLGRLWRHLRLQRPIVEPRVLILEECAPFIKLQQGSVAEIKQILGNKAYVYAPYILLRSLAVWKKIVKAPLRIPGHIREIIEETYKEPETDEPDAWVKLANELLGKKMSNTWLAKRNTNPWQISLDDEEGVQTRLDEMPTVSLVLCTFCDGMEFTFVDGSVHAPVKDKFDLAFVQALHRNLVKVPRYCFASQPETGFEFWLRGEQARGILAVDGSLAVRGLNPDIKLEYTKESGLVIIKPIMEV
jgi:CRISPR-associated endonuclease/helicase Cas3